MAPQPQETAAKRYGALSENAVRVLERRYLKKDEDGKVTETPLDMFRRVANNIAQAEKCYGSAYDATQAEEDFYNLMTSLDFLPNSPTLMNAGRELQQLSACFVLPVEDSMDSIFSAVFDTAMIHKSGGGTGFSFSRLRPANSRVRSTNGVSSGPISFMQVFDAATEAIKQGGTRRGANMGILRVDHPDIDAFIDCKLDNQRFSNFNISVALTDKFMEAVDKGEDYDLVNPHTGKQEGRLEARKVFQKIVSSAWKNGDPGIVFIDRINRDNPTPHIGAIESTNPCGEQPLLPYESCNLGSINLSNMIKDGTVDWDHLKKVVHLSVRFLDDVIDMNRYPIKKIEEMTRGNRKIGLGVMGWADFLIKLQTPYNSPAAISLASEVMQFIDSESKIASRALAKVRGPFPNYPGSVYDTEGAEPIRNATTTTIAPTGTISIIAGCSSGVEPLFALSYVRTVMDKDKLVEIHPLFEQAAKDGGYYSEGLMEKVAFHGHIEELKETPAKAREIFVTAHGISPEWHLKTQAAFQKHTDNAVSKTVNFPNEATEKQVRDVYMMAYNYGLKGVTIYRDGSRDEQVLSTGATYAGKKEKTEAPAPATAGHVEAPAVMGPSGKIAPRPRPDVIYGSTQKINTGCGSIYVTINHDETGRPFELFTQIGKAGGCAASQTESIGRLVSLGLRAGLDINEIRNQLMGISCHQPAWEKGTRILSCADAIAKAIGRADALTAESDPALVKHSKPQTKVANGSPAAGPRPAGLPIGKPSPVVASFIGAFEKDIAPAVGACPDCGGQLQHADGCLLCESCGYSKC
ncbi:MAG: vitamin B12-dependent ribonucleotide reductase [Nitrospinota bacterium]|nr:vitamin B12-dependent ribonucleotide reductase [Nitrospinota bacterium]